MRLPREGDAFHQAFGDAVRVARDRKGMTQDGLAKAVGLTRTSITNIEAGRQRPLLYKAYDLARALSVELDALMAQCAEAARKDEIAFLTKRLAELNESPPRRKRGND